MPAAAQKAKTILASLARLTVTVNFSDWFRQNVWRPALKQAGLTFNVRAHDLRHAHASWLLAGGADLQSQGKAWPRQHFHN